MPVATMIFMQNPRGWPARTPRCRSVQSKVRRTNHVKNPSKKIDDPRAGDGVDGQTRRKLGGDGTRRETGAVTIAHSSRCSHQRHALSAGILGHTGSVNPSVCHPAIPSWACHTLLARLRYRWPRSESPDAGTRNEFREEVKDLRPNWTRDADARVQLYYLLDRQRRPDGSLGV